MTASSAWIAARTTTWSSHLRSRSFGPVCVHWRGAVPKIAGSILKSADLRLDPATHEVQRGGLALDLTAKEYALLEYLLRNRGRLVTREMILAHLWDYGRSTASNVVDVHVRRLRSKVDEPFPTKLIETVRGAGYRIRDPG